MQIIVHNNFTLLHQFCQLCCETAAWGERMKSITETLVGKALLTGAIFLLGIFALPANLIAGSSKMDIVGQWRMVQPENLQNALHALLQKAQVQNAKMTQWHRNALLEQDKMQVKMQAKNREQDTKVGALAAASLRACQIQLAMARSQDDITIPGCRFIPKTR
jgi:hypothetical protein